MANENIVDDSRLAVEIQPYLVQLSTFRRPVWSFRTDTKVIFLLFRPQPIDTSAFQLPVTCCEVLYETKTNTFGLPRSCGKLSSLLNCYLHENCNYFRAFGKPVCFKTTMCELGFTAPYVVPTAGAFCAVTSPQRSSFISRGVRCARVAKVSRRHCVMQDDESEAPSDTYVPAGEGSSGTAEQMFAKRTSLIGRMLQLAAVTARGQLATSTQSAAMEDLVMQLEEVNPTAEPVNTDLIDGYWTLVYSNARLFQSSPLIALALKPLLQLGQVRQRISVTDGTLVTEGDLTAFPATSGTVKTAARITPVGGDRLEVTVEKTTVTGGKIADAIDLGGLSFDLPVERITSKLRNVSPETYFDTYYLDDKIRISRSKDGKLYIYTRLE